MSRVPKASITKLCLLYEFWEPLSKKSDFLLKLLFFVEFADPDPLSAS